MNKSWYIILANGYIKCDNKKEAKELFNPDKHMYAVYTSYHSSPDCSTAKKYYF